MLKKVEWKRLRLVSLAYTLTLFFSLIGRGYAQELPLVIHEVEILQTYPHDSSAFTQGLVIEEGVLYEGTGRNGESSLRRIDIETGQMTQRFNLDRQYFGEGIAVLHDKIYQLTWRANTGFVYERHSFTLVDSFLYSGEGWGLTEDGESLIVSDGSNTLRFIDPETYGEVKQLPVTFQGEPVTSLNELEYIDGEIWANVWYQDYIVRINPESGEVNSLVNLSNLYPERTERDAVLNGIAWDEEAGRLFVTGKLWPSLYEIDVLETPSQ